MMNPVMSSPTKLNEVISSRGISISTAAIEVGFGVCKWAHRNAMGKVVRDSFPSLCPTFTKPITMNFGKRHTYIITVNNQKYEVGPDVHHALGGQTNNGRHLTDDFPTSNNYEALVLGAISQMTANEIEHLVLGLPIHTMDIYADFLKEKFVGTFSLPDRNVRIGKVSVLPQPTGTLVRCAVEGIKIRDGINHLIIDPGYLSTDWVVANGYRIIDSRSGGKVSGVSHILRDAARLIASQYDIKFDRFERLGDALKNGTSLTVFHHEITNEDCWNFVRACQPIIDETLNEISNRVGDMDDISSIILTSGGSFFYEGACQVRFPSTPTIALPDPTYANVEGFLIAGENTRKHQ